MIANFVLQTASAPGTSSTLNVIAPPTDRVSFVGAFGSGVPCRGQAG